jgi:hypothetical protein
MQPKPAHPFPLSLWVISALTLRQVSLLGRCLMTRFSGKHLLLTQQSTTCSSIPPTCPTDAMSPRDDLSHLVDRLLVPLLDSTSRNTFLIFLRDMVFGNRTMTGPGLRALYVAFNVTEGNIPHDAIDRLFQVPTQRFEEITDIIRVKMRPNLIYDVEVVSDMSSGDSNLPGVGRPPAGPAGHVAAARGWCPWG